MEYKGMEIEIPIGGSKVVYEFPEPLGYIVGWNNNDLTLKAIAKLCEIITKEIK